MESRWSLFCVLMLTAIAASAATPATKNIDALFSNWSKPQSPGCSASAAQDGKALFARGYGMTDIEHGIPNAAGTVFHIASISKQFTAFAIHLLLQEGKLSLDDDIRKYLPELHDFGSKISVYHLLHHTSGLRDQWNLLAMAGWRLEDVITEQDILDLVSRQRELNFAPGEEELYSNTGYTLLGVIVKRVSGQSLPEFTAERIFKPLGMNHTHFHDNYGMLVANRAFSYVREPDGKYRYVALSYSNVGATSLFTTVEDLLRWDQNFYDARIGGKALLDRMQEKGKLNNGREITYASALVIGEYRGAKTIYHGGGDAGFRTNLLRFPDLHFSVAVLCNAGDADPAMLSLKVADALIGDKLKPAAIIDATAPVEIKLDTSILDAYVGEYEIAPGLIVRFLRTGEQLMSQVTGQPAFPVFATTERDFFLKVVDARITFDPPDASGKSMKVQLRQNGRDRTAMRVEPFQPDARQLQRYVGTFYSDELNAIYEVSLRDGKLFMRHLRGELSLAPTTTHSFNAGFPVGTIRFQCSDDQVCSGFQASNGRVRNLRFARSIVPVVHP